MAECMRRDEPPTRRALQEPALDQIRLDDVLDRIARLRQSGGERLDADRAATVINGDRREITPIHRIEPARVDFERPKSFGGARPMVRRGTGDGGNVAHAAEKSS